VHIPTAIDYTDIIIMPCGGVAYYDEPTYGMNYYCAQCECIVGSDAMPQACKDEEDKWAMWAELGGKGWDYSAEPDEYF
jgi:hypothetical protein